MRKFDVEEESSCGPCGRRPVTCRAVGGGGHAAATTVRFYFSFSFFSFFLCFVFCFRSFLFFLRAAIANVTRTSIPCSPRGCGTNKKENEIETLRERERERERESGFDRTSSGKRFDYVWKKPRLTAFDVFKKGWRGTKKQNKRNTKKKERGRRRILLRSR